jgi:RNA polymerase sigma factor (sigma-70 family)
MPAISDQQLLRDFAHHASQDAFSQLVRRHVDMVYASAKRQTRDSHLADDVTQAVFLILSQKAGSLKIRGSLAAWLFQTTRYACANAGRLRSIRQKHEQAAAVMKSEQVTPPSSSENADLIPLLDDAIARLGQTDRQVLLMHYFQHTPLADVGAALGLSADAARKRLTRAVAKLRTFFARRGADVQVPAVVMVLQSAIGPAPAHVTGAASSVASAASSTTLTISKGTLHMIYLAKLKAAASIAAAAVVLVGVGTTVVMQSTPSQAVAATTPAPAATTPTTPIASLRVLAKAIKNGDTETIVAHLEANNPDQQRVIEAQAKLCKSIFELRKAYGEAFGPKELAKLPQMSGPTDVPAKAKETVNGDKASIEFPGGLITLEMVKQNGVWKMAFSSIGTSNLPIPQDKVAVWLEGMSPAIAEVTLGLTNGNYKQPGEALMALQKRLQQHSQSMAAAASTPAK